MVKLVTLPPSPLSVTVTDAAAGDFAQPPRLHPREDGYVLSFPDASAVQEFTLSLSADVLCGALPAPQGLFNVTVQFTDGVSGAVLARLGPIPLLPVFLVPVLSAVSITQSPPGDAGYCSVYSVSFDVTAAVRPAAEVSFQAADSFSFGSSCTYSDVVLMTRRADVVGLPAPLVSLNTFSVLAPLPRGHLQLRTVELTLPNNDTQTLCTHASFVY